MAGFAARTEPARGAMHDLHVKVLALEAADGTRALLVTSDLLGFPRALAVEITGRIMDQTGLPREAIQLNSSHTHSGPVLSGGLTDIYPIGEEQWNDIDDYTEWLADEVVRLAGEAIGNLQPATVEIGRGVARFAVNRRNNPRDTLHQLPELAGPGDHDVPVFRISDAEGELFAVLFGYACHPTVQSGLHWSGDYPGFTQKMLEEELDGVTALFFQGAGADQNPLPRGHDSWARQYGATLAAAVLATLDREMNPLDPEIGLGYQELDLPVAPLPSDEVLAQRAANDNYIGRWARRMQELKASGTSFPTHYPFPIQVWRLGNIPVIGLGGELVSGYAISLKEIFGFDTVVMGYSNDVMNYIPTSRILLEGGYEGLTAHMVYGMHGPWTGQVEASILQASVEVAREAGVFPVNHPTGKN